MIYIYYKMKRLSLLYALKTPPGNGSINLTTSLQANFNPPSPPFRKWGMGGFELITPLCSPLLMPPPVFPLLR